MISLEKVIEINKQISTQTMVPCFYGESGVGKTTRVRDYAESVKLPLQTILLHSMLAEEVCGIPRYDQKQQKTIWSIPDWFDPINPKVYLFDELDKVRDEELGLLLTMFANKEIRGIPFPEGSVIVCAMQPIEPSMWTETKTGQALISRLLFIPIENLTSVSYLEKKYSIKMDFYPQNEVKVPMLPYPNPRQVEYYLNVVRVAGVETANEICQYMISPEFLTALSESTMKNFGLNKAKFIERVNKNIELLKKLDIYQIVSNIGELMEYGNSEVVSESLARVVEEGTYEDWKTMVENIYNYLYARAEANGGELEIINGDKQEHFYEVFAKRLEETLKIAEKRFGQKEKEKTQKKKTSNSDTTSDQKEIL